jgi:hypothetical protein
MSLFLNDLLDARTERTYLRYTMNNATTSLHAVRPLSPVARRLQLLKAGYAEVLRLKAVR